MLNPIILKKLTGTIAIVEHQPQARQTPELITGVIAGIYADDDVLAIIVSKPNSRVIKGQTPQVAVPDAPRAFTGGSTSVYGGGVVAGQPLPPMTGMPPGPPIHQAPTPPPAATISNVDQNSIKRETYYDFHIRFISISAIHSIEYFCGTRYDFTQNKVWREVQPERLFDQIETDSVVDKLTIVKNENGTETYQWSKRTITDASKVATHQFCVQDATTQLEKKLGIAKPEPAPVEPEPAAEESGSVGLDPAATVQADL